MSDLLEEITWQGELNGQKIIMTAHHVIWLGKESDRFQMERKECECLCHRPQDNHAVYKCPCNEPAKPSAVEETIKKLSDKYCIGKIYHRDKDNFCEMELELHALVDLVRKETK